nr:hypothetical protein [Candidatus Sigynarchaeota archaeon]
MREINSIVDGSNVAFFRRNPSGKPMMQNLLMMMEYLEKKKLTLRFSYEIIVDASLKYQIDDKATLSEEIKKGKILECPSRMKADTFIMEYYNADPKTTIIISNDNYKDEGFVAENGWSLCKFMIIGQKVIIPAFNAAETRVSGSVNNQMTSNEVPADGL